MKFQTELRRKCVRLTPSSQRPISPARSLISFGQKQRAIGEAAKTLEVSNFKNTAGSLKRMIGRSLSDSDVQNVEKRYINCTLVDVSGAVGVEVSYI